MTNRHSPHAHAAGAPSSVMAAKRGLGIGLTALSMVCTTSFVATAQAFGPENAATIAIDFAPEFHPGTAATGLHVHYRLDGAHAGPDGSLSFAADGLTPSGRSTDQITDLSARDAQGPLPLLPTAAKGEDGPTWKAGRAAVGELEIDYRVPVAIPNPPLRGPQEELQAAGDGISTSGLGVLLLPVEPQSFHARLHWVLPSGLTAASSFGEGDVSFTATRKRMLESFYTAGSLYSFKPSATSAFTVHGLGQPGYDAAPLFAWAARWYDVSLKAFHGSPTMPFRVFYRSFNGMNSESGFSPGSVMLYLPPAPAPISAWPAKQIVAHEMVHIWVPGLDVDEGSGWYSEGMADFLSVNTPYQAGLYTPREYQDLVNSRASVYYGNARRNLSTTQVETTMWSGGADSWTTHYMRGFMYLADLDAKLRKRSGGKVDVLVLVNEMNARHARGEKNDLQTWAALVQRYGGPDAVRDFNDMMAGKTIFPEAGSFGPCLLSQPASIGVFDPGYTAKRGADSVKIVTEVTDGSNAAKAGLKPGDQILHASDMTSAYSAPDRPLTLDVQRGDQRETMAFVPRRGEVSAVRWIPRSGNPDAPCPR